MNIGLIHNARAGDAISAEDLAATITRHGHRVCAVARPSDGVGGMDLPRLDVVAAAGGDGTIASAARSLAGTGVPMAVLPMGTANNVAGTLNIPTDTDEAIAAWNSSAPRAFDLGLASGSWGERRFMESVGGGLVTHGTVVMDRRALTNTLPSEQVIRARRAHADVLEAMTPVTWRMIIDGAEVSGRYLLVEVLNIRSVGPNLALSDQSSPHDGRFTVVAATRDHVPALLRYLRGEPGADTLDGLLVWNATQVTLLEGDRLHVDDEVLQEPDGPGVKLEIEPGALRVLMP